MGRKTFEVDRIVSRMNGVLSAPSATTEVRQTLCALAEGILFDTDNYAGFAYVDPNGKQVPVERIDSGDYDEYRRRYFLTAVGK